jgi:glycosyltransferase involved in cell wall biosynthesis
MRIALVTPSYRPHAGALERHVYELAHGLAHRGLEVEVLTQDRAGRLPSVSESEGVVVRRFTASIRKSRAAVAPGLWHHMRRTARSFDVAHAHGDHVSLGLVAARAGARSLVFTPHGLAQQMLRWPFVRATGALVAHAGRTVCASHTEAELLRRAFSSAAARIMVVPNGVEAGAIKAAEPFPAEPALVLSVGRLERYHRIDRAIAAMAALNPTSRLVIVGQGSSRRSLGAYAADLLVSSQVSFVGPVSDAELYRWLRTARVLVALAEQRSSGLQLLESFAAGVPAVASDIPVHREIASHAGGAGVKFVSPTGSPLEIADAICEAARLKVAPAATRRLSTWDEVVESTLGVYNAAIRQTKRTTAADARDQQLMGA